MKKVLAAAVLAIVLECVPGAAAAPAEIAVYVSAGAEDGDGSFEKPFGTLEEARDKVRILKKDADSEINVYLREGIYSRSETFVLDEHDSGSAEVPVTWQSYRGETATIIGGAELVMADFVVADDAAIPDDARGKVYKCNIKKMTGNNSNIGCFSLSCATVKAVIATVTIAYTVQNKAEIHDTPHPPKIPVTNIATTNANGTR